MCIIYVQLPVCGKERASPCVCYLFVRYYSKLKYCPLNEHCPQLYKYVHTHHCYMKIATLTQKYKLYG